MKILRLRHFFLALCCLFALSCANKTLIRDIEYDPVYRTLTKPNAAEEALLVFPKKEEQGFITTFEKAWIKFWTQKDNFTPDDIAVVQKLSDQIEKRKFISISHEASVFLVGESEDGYIPSEHEIISLHLFLSMLYLDAGNRDAAHVELKRAVEYIANNPEGKVTTFDDPAIRVWLSVLWQAMGDINAANVDLRKAMELSGSLKLKKSINSRERKIVLLMKGLGPRTNWSDSGLSFFFDYHLDHYDEAKNENEFSTRKWYEWHQNRNSTIRERLLSSHYMMASLRQKTSQVSRRTAGLAFTGFMYIGAAAVGVTGIYAATQVASGADNILYLTAGAVGWIALKANEFYNKIDIEIEESKKIEAENLKIYRMIRFLPSSIEYIDENLDKRKRVPHLGYRKKLGAGNNQVEFIWNP